MSKSKIGSGCVARSGNRIIDRGFRLTSILLAGYVGSTGSDAWATSEVLVRIEPHIESVSAANTWLTHFIIIDDSTLLQQLLKEESTSAVVSVYASIESGASVLAFAPPQRLEQNVNYMPIDMTIGFSRPGVFMGKVELEIQFEDHVLMEIKNFWIKNDDQGVSLISYPEYEASRMKGLTFVKTDPYANLEAGDVPGEAILGPNECVKNSPMYGGKRCQK